MPFVGISKCSVCESAYGPYSFSAGARRDSFHRRRTLADLEMV